MKNKLLFTTALVAAVFAASNTMASLAIESGEEISEDYLGHNSSEDRISFLGDATLKSDVTMGNYVTLHNKTKLDGDKKLTVTGYLTQTAEGSDISGIDLEMQKGEVTNGAGQQVSEGELVLGNKLTVGNVTMADGTGVFLYKTSEDFATGAEKTMTIADGKTVTFAGNNYIKGMDGASLTFDGAGSVVNNGVLTSDSAIKTLTDIDNNGTIIADIISDAGAGSVNMTSAASKIDGKVTGANLYFQANHTLSDAVDGEINAHQIMVSNGGSLIANQTFTANDLVIGSKNGRTGTGSLTLKADATTGGAKVNSGSVLDLGDNTLKISGGQFQGHDTARFMEGSTLAFNFGKGKIDGSVNIEGTATLKPTIALGTEDGSYDFITGDVTHEDLTAQEPKDFDADATWTGYEDNSLYDISVENEKTLVIKKRAQDEMAANLGANSNQAGAVAAIVSGGEADGNTAFNQVAGQINALLQGNSAEKAAGMKMLDQMSADTSSYAQSSSLTNTVQVMNAIGSRLSGGFGSAGQGMSSGDSLLEKGAVWARGIVNKTELDKTNGFDADSNGVAFGAEKQITDSTKAGIGYAYTNTDIDTDSREIDADTHTAFVYGEYKPSNWYVNGLATYSWGDYDEHAAVKKASYDVNSFGLQAMTGYDMQFNSINFTPEAGLRYVNIDQKSYTDSLGNRVSGDNSDILTGVIGAKASKDFALESGLKLRPEARLAMTYDLTHDDSNAIVSLANGAAYTVEGEALDRFGIEFGAGLTADVNDNVELSLGYEGKFREDYTDHTGLLNAKYKF